METFILLVETKWYGNLSLSVSRSTSVWQMKVMLQEKTGIPTDRQLLRLCNHASNDHEAYMYLGNLKTLEYYGIVKSRAAKPPTVMLEDSQELVMPHPNEPIYSRAATAVFVEAPPLAANYQSSKEEDDESGLDSTGKGGGPLQRSATEFLTMPTNNLFEVEDVLAIVLSFVDRRTKLNGCRLVNHRFKSLLSGPAPYIVEIPPIEQTNGSGCFGCFEPKVLTCSGGEEHVVMAGPDHWCWVVLWAFGILLFISSLAGSITGLAVTKDATWSTGIFVVVATGMMTVLGISWRRFVINYRTRRVTKSNPFLMLFGFGLCCCRDEAPLSKFQNFNVSSHTYTTTETDSRGRERTSTHTHYTSHAAGWSWSGETNMNGCRDLSRQIFDPNKGFFPPENPVWKMV